jgi:uncharacterized protein RhaS with RHS repeats
MHRKIALYALLAVLTLTGFQRAHAVYDPTIGRWISRDPLNNAEMLQGPNLYAYVGNNPVYWTDRTGLFFGIDDAIEADVALNSALGLAIGTALVATPQGQALINAIANAITDEDNDEDKTPAAPPEKKCQEHEEDTKSVQDLTDKEKSIKQAYPDQPAGRTRTNLKKMLRDIANDPDSADDLE